MFIHVTLNVFQDAMTKVRPDNFSFQGLSLLFDYLEDLEESLDKPIKLDPIGFCCEYAEYTTEEALAGIDDSEKEGLDLNDNEAVEDLIVSLYDVVARDGQIYIVRD